jgi:very-short-patch-repair endonuclease
MIEDFGLEPAKQYKITAPGADRPFTIPDFAFEDKKVALFIDGVDYHVGDRLRRDKAIDEKLKGLGWRVLRFTAQDIHRGKLAEELPLF